MFCRKAFLILFVLEGVLSAISALPSKEYYVETFFEANFFQAYEFCRFHDMQLATVSNEKESEEILYQINLMGIADQRVWVSGSDLGHEGKFVWLSTGKLLAYSNFSTDQPDNAHGIENCLEIRMGGSWNDWPCDKEQYFI